MTEIERLQADADRLRGELQRAEQLLRAAEIATCPVQIGEIVTVRGKEYRVTAIDPRFRSHWLKGNPRKADGSFGTSERHLYSDWKALTP